MARTRKGRLPRLRKKEVTCHLCPEKIPPGKGYLMVPDQEKIRANPHTVTVKICKRCAKKLLEQGYHSATAKSGQLWVIKPRVG